MKIYFYILRLMDKEVIYHFMRIILKCSIHYLHVMRKAFYKVFLSNYLELTENWIKCCLAGVVNNKILKLFLQIFKNGSTGTRKFRKFHILSFGTIAKKVIITFRSERSVIPRKYKNRKCQNCVSILQN